MWLSSGVHARCVCTGFCNGLRWVIFAQLPPTPHFPLPRKSHAWNLKKKKNARRDECRIWRERVPTLPRDSSTSWQQEKARGGGERGKKKTEHERVHVALTRTSTQEKAAWRACFYYHHRYCDSDRQCSSPHQLVSNHNRNIEQQMQPNTIFDVRQFIFLDICKFFLFLSLLGTIRSQWYIYLYPPPLTSSSSHSVQAIGFSSFKWHISNTPPTKQINKSINKFSSVYICCPSAFYLHPPPTPDFSFFLNTRWP